MHGVFQPLEERLAFAKLDAARLLRLADGVEIALDIGDIAQRDRHRIPDFIRYTDTVQAGGKLAGVGGADKQNGHRQRDKIFQRDIEHIKQLLGGDVVPPEQVAQHRAGAVQCGALVGVKQVDKKVVQQQKHQHKHEHKPHFFVVQAAELERRQADRQQPQQQPGVVGDHTGKGEQQKKRQLGRAGQPVNNALAREVIQNRFSSHGCAPPGRRR